MKQKFYKMVVFCLLIICLFSKVSELALAQPSASFSVKPYQKLVLGRNFTANCSVTVPNPLIDYFVSIDKDGRNLGQWSVFGNQHFTNVILFFLNSKFFVLFSR